MPNKKKPKMCFFSPKPSSKSSKSKSTSETTAKKQIKPVFSVHEKRTAGLPSQVRILRKDSSASIPEFDTYMSLAEHVRLEKVVEAMRERQKDEAELNRFREKEIEGKKMAKEEREREQANGEWDEKLRVEGLEREVRGLKMGGAGVGAGALRLWQEAGFEDGSGMEVFRHQGQGARQHMVMGRQYEMISNMQQGFGHQQQQRQMILLEKQARKQRRQEILGEIDFIHSLGKKFAPYDAAKSLDKRDAKLGEIQSELGKLKKELQEMQLEGRLEKVREEGRLAGVKDAEEKGRLLGQVARTKERRVIKRDRERVWDESSSTDSEDGVDFRFHHGPGHSRRFERDRVRARDNIRAAQYNQLDLAALAKLPGRWNFAISSPTYSPDTAPNEHKPQRHNQARAVPFDNHDPELLSLQIRIGKLEAALPAPAQFQFKDPMEVWENDKAERAVEREMKGRLVRTEVREKEREDRQFGEKVLDMGRGGGWGRGPVGWGA